MVSTGNVNDSHDITVSGLTRDRTDEALTGETDGVALTYTVVSKESGTTIASGSLAWDEDESHWWATEDAPANKDRLRIEVTIDDNGAERTLRDSVIVEA
jgi:hypothetical protein